MTPEIDELYEEALGYLEAWNLDQAEECLRKLIELDPEHARGHNKLGVVFDPNLATAHSNLGNIYAERNWMDRAKAAYERALALDPGNPTATHNLGVLYRKSGEIGRGIDLMKQANRSERHRFRDETRRNPESRRIMRIGWAVVIAIGLALFYLFNR